MKWNERIRYAVQEVLNGDVPGFLKRFVPVKVSIIDSTTGKMIDAVFMYRPIIYLSVQMLTGPASTSLPAAQRIADSPIVFTHLQDGGWYI